MTPDFVRECLTFFSFTFVNLLILFLFKIEEDPSRVRVGVTAIVRVTLKDGTFHEVCIL